MLPDNKTSNELANYSHVDFLRIGSESLLCFSVV